MLELQHHKLTDVPADKVDQLVAFADSIGVSAVPLGLNPQIVGDSSPATRDVGLAFLDERSVDRIRHYIASGYVERSDPIDPEVAEAAGFRGTRNADLEFRDHAARVVGNLGAAERAGVHASSHAATLRDLAAHRPVLVTRDEDGDRRSWKPPTVAKALHATWAERLEDLAALCDLVELEAGRRAAAADAEIADLPEHLRPARVPAHLGRLVVEQLDGTEIDAGADR